jgi:pimeloyl-ACP methyl ester carboxylesterase
MSRQRVVKFGTVAPLTGVLTESSVAGSRERPAVILLNSGILHHVGACRLHVQLARKLADAGYISLRFDFSGIGDSEARRDDLSFEASAPLETRDAIDYLARAHGTQQVILMGLCSGADVAHLAAVDDNRVVGLGLLDPWAYRTRRYWMHYYGHRVVRPAVYVNWARVRLGRLRDAVRKATEETNLDPDMYEMPRYVREFPPRERVARDLQGFMRRRVELFCLFSGGMEDVYNHRAQYRASFPEVDFGDRLRVEHLVDASHVFSGLEHQEFVVREFSAWISAKFPASTAANRVPSVVAQSA